jgi:glycosyltransferase involved in cell wall biosynthesis
MVVFSQYPFDPRPRRAIAALTDEGMSIDLICEYEDKSAKKETVGNLRITRIPIRHFRGGAVSYAYQYFSFIFFSAWILAWRSLRKRYDLVYVHNMPDVLVASALIPKLLGAKVILDQHDPMPELMMTIFGREESSFVVRVIRRLEKWSLRRADLVITVNEACRKIFAARSRPDNKIVVVMNSPDETIFPCRPARSYAPAQKSGQFIVMYHGSLVERNGLELAVDALARIHDEMPNAELRVFGRSTPYLEQVLAKAEKLGLKENVHYLGSRKLEQLAGDIQECNVGVIPNQRNAFTDINTPTRIFEYLSMGKPVVAPDTSAIVDYFGQDELFYFTSGDAESLADALRNVAADGAETVANAERGQQVYLRHSWQQERERLIQSVCELLDNESTQREPTGIQGR